jgi:hypothetical protein
MPDQHQPLEAGFRLLDSGHSSIGGAAAERTAAAVLTWTVAQHGKVPGTWRMGLRNVHIEAQPHAD